MSHGLRAAVFDLDGLMFNTEELYHTVGAELLARRGHRISQELIGQMMGRPAQVALRIMIEWHDLSDSVETLQRETEAIFSELLATRLAPMPGLIDLLRRLDDAGVPKAIATSSRRRFVDDVLRHCPLDTQFPLILTAEDVVQGKPHPEIYLTAAQRLGWPPERLLVLEDSENGCRAAVAAGTFAVAVPGAHSRHHDFRGAALIADSLADPRIVEVLELGN